MDKYVITGFDTQSKPGRIFLWHARRPKVVPIDLPVIYPSRPLTSDEMEALIYELKKMDVDVALESRIRLSHVGDSYRTCSARQVCALDCRNLGKRWSVCLVGDSSLKQRLYPLGKQFDIVGSKERDDSRHNLARLHKLQVGWPFSAAHFEDDLLHFDHDPVSVDILCRFPVDAFDSEFEGWEPFHDFDLDVPSDVLIGRLRPYYECEIQRQAVALAELEQKRDVVLGYDYVESRLLRNELFAIETKIERSQQCIDDLRQELSGLDGCAREVIVRAFLDMRIKEDEFAPFMICYYTSTRFPNFCFSKYPLSNDSEFVDTPLGDALFHNIVVEDVSQMRDAVVRLETILGDVYKDALWSYFSDRCDDVKNPSDAITFLFAITKRLCNAFLSGGHNVGSYDYPNIRAAEPKKSLLVCGIDGEAPHQQYLGWRYRTTDFGRHTLDTCLVSQMFFPGTVDDKLVTFIRHAYGVDHAKDDLSYEQTSRLRIQNSLGDKRSGDVVARYCMKDTMLHFYAMEAVKRSVFLLSKLTRAAPEVVTSTKYQTLSENWLQVRSLEERCCYLPRRFGDGDEFDVEREKNRLLFPDDSSLFEGMADALKHKTVSNIVCDIFYLTPFVNAFIDVVEGDPAGAAVLSELNVLCEKSFCDFEGRLACLNKSILAQGLQRHFLSILVNEALAFHPARGSSVISDGKPTASSIAFEQVVGRSPLYYHNRVVSAWQQFHHLMRKYDVDVINFDLWAALMVSQVKRRSFIEELEASHLGYYYGDARIISLAKNKFLFYAYDEPMTQGFDVKFTRGLRNSFETSFMRDFCRVLFEHDGFAKAVGLVESAVSSLRSGDVPISRLVYVRKVLRDPEERSGGANDRMSEMMIKYGAKKGDRFAWAYTMEGPLPAPDALRLAYDRDMVLKAMFGDVAVCGKSFRTYAYQKECVENTALFGNVRGVKDAHASSSCGSVVESVLVYNSVDPAVQKQKAAALRRLVRLEHSEQDRILLSTVR